MSCIIFIVLQNDFFCSECMLKEKYLDRSKIIPNIKSVVEYARKTDIPIFWIKSLYSGHKLEPIYVNDTNENKNSIFLATGHCSKTRKCCETNSFGAEFIDEVKDMINDKDFVVFKNRYSMITGSNITDILKEKGLSKLFIGGVMTNVCVMASSCDSYFSGYDVTVLEDCTMCSSVELHEKSLDKIKECYGSIIKSIDLINE